MKAILSISITLAVLFAVVGCSGNANNLPPLPTPPRLGTSISKPSATPPLAIGDGGVLSGEPCSPPCFLGIESGRTTETEIPTLLAQAGLSNTCEYHHYFDKIINDWIHGWYCHEMIDIEISEEGVVESIRFEPPSPIPLQSIIDRYGLPDAVMVLNLGLPDYPSLEADVWYARLHMVFLLMGSQEDFTYSVEPTTLIHVIRYESPDSWKDYIAYFADNAQPWYGYGTYSPGP